MKLKPILEELLPGASKTEDRKLKRRIAALKLLSGKEKSAEMEKILNRVNLIRRTEGKPEFTEKGFRNEIAPLVVSKNIRGKYSYTISDERKKWLDNQAESRFDMMSFNPSSGFIKGAVDVLRDKILDKRGMVPSEEMNLYLNYYRKKLEELLPKAEKMGKERRQKRAQEKKMSKK